ncbi:protein PBDC1 [Tetranychus urticae]|uniref:Polysaccharide biosynthesis domain-containing protein n=1 Tax=Tetranychus urticae TaxID=32264 RepID=T1JW66_TETUR|nr:protein PBDC1 [Tetranychus urticae]
MASSIKSMFTRPADEFVNDPDVEKLWSIKAVDQMIVHYNLISSVPPRDLKLTKKDDMIYETFKETFPDFKLDVISTDDLKSEESKNKWRPFCETFKGEVEDYNFASLVRLDCKGDYSEENTVVVPRIQFLAIEIARNRQGLNDTVYQESQSKKQKQDKN